MLNETQKEALFLLVQEFVRTPSLSGEEGAFAALLQKRMFELGIETVKTDLFGNVIGEVRFSEDGPALLLESHMDHVGASDVERWARYPYGGEIADGRIWGRGSMDNKGALAAMLMSAHLAASEPEGLKGRLYVAGSVHNELMEGASSASIAEICDPDFVVVGEASDHLIMHGQRGRAEILLETRGRSTLSAMPHQGINAVSKMIKLIGELEKMRLPTHPELGQAIMELTSISSLPASGINVVPDGCRVRFDRRFSVGETRESILAWVREVIDKLAAKDGDFEAAVSLPVKEYRCYTGTTLKSDAFMPAWLFPRDHPLIAGACAGMRLVGLEPRLSVYPFSSNGSYYAGVLGKPTIGFGPYAMSRAHMDNEYIAQDDLTDLCRGYCGIVRALLGSQ